MEQQGARAWITRYPSDDSAFEAAIDTSMHVVGGRAIENEAIVAAIQASIRTTYPLATVRPGLGGAARTAGWEAFRDESALDNEMVRRARLGDEAAVDDLYERHHALAYDVAMCLAGRSEAAAAAVVAAFRETIVGSRDASPVRERLATAARDAAGEATPARPRSRVDDARLVVKLASVHGMSGTQIARIIRADIREVAALANEGLRSCATRPV